MRAFNLVKSLSTRVNNITSLPFRERLGLGRLILCLSLAVLGVNDAWGRETNYLINDSGETRVSADTYSKSFDKPALSISFNAYKQTAGTGGIYVISKDVNSKELNKENLTGLKTSYPKEPYSYPLSRSARSITLEAHGTLKKWIKDIKVTQATYLEVDNVVGQTSVTKNFGTEFINSQNSTTTFVVNYSNVDNMTVKITGEGASQFSVDKNSITGGKGSYGNETITITYKHSVEGEHKAVVTVSDGTSSITVNVSGKTIKYTATMSWKTGTNVMNVGDIFTTEALNYSDDVRSIVFTTSNATIIKINDNGYPEAVSEGKTTITATQAETAEFYETKAAQEITVTNKQKQLIEWTDKLSFKYEDSQFTQTLTASANTNITYSLSDVTNNCVSLSGNVLTIKNYGTAYVTATAAETSDYVGVSMTRKVIIRDPDAACETIIYGPSKEYDLDMGWNDWGHKTVTKESEFVDEPRSMTIEYKGEPETHIFDYYTGSFIIYEYYEGNWHELKDFGKIQTDIWKSATLNLNRKTTKVQFKGNEGMGHFKYRNVTIYLAKYIETSTSSLSFDGQVGISATNTFDVNYSDVQGPIEITSSNSDIFTFSPSSIEADCEQHGTVKVTVTLNSKKEINTLSETITISNGVEPAQTITVSGKVTKRKQDINWNDQITYNSTDKPTLSATATSGLAISSYSSSNENIAKVVDGNKLEFYSSGKVNITAHQDGDDFYEPASLTKEFTINKVTPTIVALPTVGNAITYGSPLSDVALTGGSAKDDKNNAVSGHFEWVNPNEIPHGGQQNYTVRFVPDNTNMYTSDAVSTETLAITVNKADQTLTWEVEDPIKIKKEDGNYTLTASSTSGRAITYTLSDPTLGTINGDKLTPLKSGDCTITAVCPPDGDYNASNFIEKKLYIAGPDEIVWKYKTGDRVWAGQNLNADGNLATAHTTVWFGKDETQGYLTVYNNTDPKTVYTAIASDGTLVTISATTAGDDYYALVSSSIQVYIDRCYQGLNWNQSFVSYTATAEGYIDETVPLTAVAVDSLNKPTNLPIVYSVNNADVAEITGNATDGWKLHIKGAGEATLTASVAQTNIYQGVTETRKINVRKEGERCGSYALISTGEKNINQIKDNTYTFDKPGETLTFKTRKYSRLTITEDVTVEGWNISNQAWERIDQYKLNFTSKQTKTYTINENIRKIRMYTGADIEDDFRYISDLYITQKSYLRSNVGEIDINVDVNNDFSTEFEISYSDIPLIQFNLTNDHETNLVLEPLQAINNDCGEAGVYKFRLSGRWDLLKDPCQETLTFKTSANDELVIPINVSVRTGETFEIYTDGNWNSGSWTIVGQATTKKPGASNIVNINANITVTNMEEAYQIVLGQDGKLTIAPNGGLTIYTGGISGATADNLIIESSHNNQGYLRISPLNATPMPKATVQLATRSTLDNGANKDATWQYVGIPTATQSFEVDYITWLYEWSEPNGWVNLKNVAQPVTLNAWKGYAVTQYGQPTYEWKGQLLREDKIIELTCTTTGSGMNGDNLFANSYSSPIDVKRFTEDDFEGTLDKTFYIFNSGSWNQWNDNKGEMVKSGTMSSTNPGQYIGIPALGASYLEDDLTMIAPMQGVYVYTETGGAKIKLNYTKHVWQASSTKGEMNLPLRAPQDNGDIDALVSEEMRMRDSIARVDREKCEALSHRIRISATSENSGADFLYVLEEENFTHGYDNGYEAPKIMADAEGVLNIYTNEAEAGLMSVAATNDVNEMFIGFNAGEDVNYELYITSVIGDDLELMDMQTGDRFALKDSVSYAFAATPNSEDPYRFRIFKSETKPVVPTGWTGLGDKAKIWYNKQTLYISDAAANSTAAIYTADGVTLKQVTFNHNTTISTADMPEGVYTVRVEDSVLKFFVKH